jgi:hypothetical protein
LTFFLSDHCLTKAVSNENKPDLYSNFFYKKIQECSKPSIHLCPHHHYGQTSGDQFKAEDRCRPKRDCVKGRGKGRSEEIRNLNAYLDQVQAKLLQCHGQLVQEDRIVSSNTIKTRFLGEDEVSRTLMDLIEYHNGNMVHVLKPGTMKNYYTTEKYLKRFLKSNFKQEDIYLKQLNYRFILDLEHYLS